MGSTAFMTDLMNIYARSYTTNKNTIAIKDILSYFLEKYNNKYNETQREQTKNSIISLTMYVIAEAYGQYVEELRKRRLINNQLELS